jgi:hypothetical protein
VNQFRFHFAIDTDPLTTGELNAELDKLKQIRKTQIKQSCISDVLHAFVFIALYFYQMLSGYAVLAAVGISTVPAILLATLLRNPLSLKDFFVITMMALGGSSATLLVLWQVMLQPLPGSLIAACATASIVVVGATLGRNIKQVMSAIEELKPISNDEAAVNELRALCGQYPELEQYRSAAAQNLRPHLTYGELAAMRQWQQRQQEQAEG